MGQRLDLHQVLIGILGSSQVFFQKPPSVQMNYPAIVYELDTVRARHADNRPYSHKKRYQVTVIDRDPDSTLPDAIGALESAEFDRSFRSSDLNHFVYKLYF